jgi:peptidyl-tRNA hydrolase
MSPGKISAQTGHAYLDTYLKAYDKDIVRCMEWKKDHHGIKVALRAKNLDKLLRLQSVCEDRDIPCALIEDLGYTCFEGRNTFTVLGIGPIRKSELPELQKLSLVK